MFGISRDFTLQCTEYFGKKDQLDILIEECSELIKACCKMKRENEGSVVDPYDSLKEELAHVAISSSVVSHFYGVEQKHIDEEVEKKRLKYNFRKEQHDHNS